MVYFQFICFNFSDFNFSHMKNVHTLNILQFKKVGVYFLAFMNQSRMLLIASFVVLPHIERAQSAITKRKKNTSVLNLELTIDWPRTN